MDIEQAAKKALERPSDFWTQDERIGTTHGFTISVHRDSDILGQSNWEVIKDDMIERFGNNVNGWAPFGNDDAPDVYVHSSRHWAYGWIDQLAVRVHSYDRVYAQFGMRKEIPSTAFRAIMEWNDALEDYPVADESHYSEMEYDDAIETLENSYGVPKEKSGEAFSWLFDTYSYCSAEEYNQDAIADMVAALGLDCQNCGLYRAKKTHTKQIPYGTVKEALCVSCYIDATRKR